MGLTIMQMQCDKLVTILIPCPPLLPTPTVPDVPEMLCQPWTSQKDDSPGRGRVLLTVDSIPGGADVVSLARGWCPWLEWYIPFTSEQFFAYPFPPLDPHPYPRRPLASPRGHSRRRSLSEGWSLSQLTHRVLH